MAKILILDDEPITVDMLSIFVRMTGHEAIGAMSVPQHWRNERSAVLEHP